MRYAKCKALSTQELMSAQHRKKTPSRLFDCTTTLSHLPAINRNNHVFDQTFRPRPLAQRTNIAQTAAFPCKQI